MATLLWTPSSWTMSTALTSLRTPHQTPPPPPPPLQPSETVTSSRTGATGVPWVRNLSGREVWDHSRTEQTDLLRTGWDIQKVGLGCVLPCCQSLRFYVRLLCPGEGEKRRGQDENFPRESGHQHTLGHLLLLLVPNVGEIAV